jgi:hypothetical protein
LLHLLDLLPKLILDDAKTIDLPRHPFALGIEAGDSLACFWVLEEALPVVGNPPGVQFVVEYSIPS